MIAISNRTNRTTRLFGERPASSVGLSVQRELEQSPLFRGRCQLIRVEERDGDLVLEGRLPSFYLKQMLQTILQKLDGVEHIDNRVRVDYPPTR